VFANLNLQYKYEVLYPEIYGSLNITVTSKTFIVHANMSSEGKISCAALKANTSLSSANAVKQYGVTETVLDASKMVKVTIDGLSPSTEYDVYCYTEDFSSHAMTYAAVLETKRSISTKCCRGIDFTTTYGKISEYSSSSTTSDSVFTFTLDSTPLRLTTITVSATELMGYTCEYNVSGTSQSAKVYPSSYTFSPSSLSLSGSFIVRGTAGCYKLTAAANYGSSFSNSSTVLYIRSSTVAPDPPELASAYFSDDGTKIIMNLDSASDRGATKIAGYTGSFTCTRAVWFIDASSAKCVWTSSSQLTATLGTSTLVNIGATVTLSANRIMPLCSASQTCSYSSGNNVTLGSPLNAIVPTVSIASAASVGGCDDIVLDPTSSTGDAGRCVV
jgi:hypothetical protein